MTKRTAASIAADPLSTMPDRTVSEARAALAPLLALLDIVGPADASALLAQLRADLKSCADMIETATPSQDWHTLRRASHNLSALAGTAGAEDLQRLAEEMNQAAHAMDPTALLHLGPRALSEIATLEDLIGTLAANGKAR